ncbi:cytochrome b [Bradyrhizobium sp. 2TAF24]|uniref:cytochrome b n=1 Tax=Bradyrhizobium sp. 2TAF24 TaxID=3233011 RepID=UPI003F8F0AC2
MRSLPINDDTGYAPLPKLLHWITVVLVAAVWILGTWGDDLPDSVQTQAWIVHMSAGLLILAVACVRIPWRVASQPPQSEPTRLGTWLIEWTDPAARVMHYCLYGLLVAVPVAGIVLQFMRGHDLPVFGLFQIPSPFVPDKATAHLVKEVHEVLANALVILALFHMTAAIVHHVVFRDGTLERMLPRARR